MEVPADMRCRQVQGSFASKKKQQSTGVGERKMTGTMGWKMPRGNMLNVMAAASIAVSPTMMSL
jgi:hypothetical protein